MQITLYYKATIKEHKAGNPPPVYCAIEHTIDTSTNETVSIEYTPLSERGSEGNTTSR